MKRMFRKEVWLYVFVTIAFIAGCRHILADLGL